MQQKNQEAAVFNSEEVEKPRRNLLLVCCILIFHYLAGLDISEFSALDTKLKITRPEWVWSFVWLLFFYFLWRYFLKARQAIATYRKEALFCFKADDLLYPLAEALTLPGSTNSDVPFNKVNIHIVYPSAKRGFFKRTAVCGYLSSFGEYAEHEFPVSYRKLFFYEVAADIRCAMESPAFLEGVFPFYVVVVPLVLALMDYLEMLN